MTGLFLLLGVLLLLAWPALIGSVRPRDRAEAVVYSRRLTIYLGALVLTLVGAGTGAMLVMRQAKDEYRREARKNLQRLVEATREDAQSKDG
jgi:hypothetical protein